MPTPSTATAALPALIRSSPAAVVLITADVAGMAARAAVLPDAAQLSAPVSIRNRKGPRPLMFTSVKMYGPFLSRVLGDARVVMNRSNIAVRMPGRMRQRSGDDRDGFVIFSSELRGRL